MLKATNRTQTERLGRAASMSWHRDLCALSDGGNAPFISSLGFPVVSALSTQGASYTSLVIDPNNDPTPEVPDS